MMQFGKVDSRSDVLMGIRVSLSVANVGVHPEDRDSLNSSSFSLSNMIGAEDCGDSETLLQCCSRCHP